MTLRGAVSNAQESLRLRRLDLPSVPERLAETARRLSQRMDRVGVLSPDFDLNAFSKKVAETHHRGDWSVLSNADLRRIAMVLRSSDFPIGIEIGFLPRYLKEIRNREQPLLIKALVGHYLRNFDDSEEIEEIGVFLSSALHLPQLQNRLNDWRERHAIHKLFEPGVAASQLAQAILEEQDAEKVFTSAGIFGDAQTAGIGAETFKTVCGRVRESLNAESGPGAINTLTGLAYPAPGQFRYQKHRSALADALLTPWRRDEPSAEVKKLLERFFDSAFGDPRFQRERWQGSSDAAKDVRMRWLAEKDLEFFFKVVDNSTGRKDQWKYRRAFWSAYVGKGHTKGSWIAFGPNAQVAARQAASDEATTEDRKPNYGRLSGGDSRHSVLFLRIGSLVIADWSFNGRLRIWHETNPQAPSFYQTEEHYQNFTVRRGADFELIHFPVNGPGNWQGKAQKIIRRHTGIQLAENDYMPYQNPVR